MALKKEKLERPILIVKDGKIVNSGKIKLPDGTHRVVPESAIRNIPQPKKRGGKVAAKKMAVGGKAKKKSKGMARGGKTMMKSKGMKRGGKMSMKSKGMARGGKMKSKGMKRGGKAKR